MRDWVETLIAHELAYSFLSKVFYEPPSQELIDTLAAESLFDTFPLETDETEVETGLQLLRDFCAGWDSSADQFEALQHDYRKLFIGPGHLLAPPWESVYTSPDHLLFDAQTLQVRYEYQRFGMPIPKLHNEPEDHLGLELRFIVHLCGIGMDAIEQEQPEVLDTALTEISSFLNKHLLKWAPQCLNFVIEKSKSDYYRGCAHLTLGCLAHTSAVLQPETAQ